MGKGDDALINACTKSIQGTQFPEAQGNRMAVESDADTD